MDEHTDDKADDGGNEPEEVLAEQGKVLLAERHERAQMQTLLKRGGKRFQSVQDRGGPSADHHADIDRAVMVKEPADKRKNDQRDGRRVDEHEHRNGVLDDRAQTHVGDGKREEGKDDRPDRIGDPAARHFDKCFRARGNKTDGGLEAGKGDRNGENEHTGFSKVVFGNFRQRDTAVGRELEKASRLRAHEDRQHVNDGHQDTSQNARAEDVTRYRVVIADAHAADDVNDHDAEGQARNGVHRAVALDERREKRAGLIGRFRLHVCHSRARMDERPDDQNGEENQENGIDDLADPDRDLARL